MNASHTKESWAEYMREYRKRKPHILKSIDLKKRFGISLEEFELMYEQQGGVCSICKQPELTLDHRTKKPRYLAVDHCHTTGRIRGLLCTKCNTALGLFCDDVDLLKQAIDYLGRN